jgi:putative nucleotidyltransferase with HDIG domain
LTLFTPRPDDLQRLIKALAVGADQRVYTPDDWAARFVFAGATDDAARTFLVQLRQEWMPIFFPDGFCHLIHEFVSRHLSEYGGFHPVWAHTLRVTGSALALAQQAGVDLSHAFVMGMLHDVAKLDPPQGDETHEQIGAEIARELLARRYSAGTVSLIANVIGKRARASNPYRQLLHDADKLDKIGATGILRRLSTAFGARHTEFVLRRIRAEYEQFRPMHFTASIHMADLKKRFTAQFLAAVDTLEEA